MVLGSFEIQPSHFVRVKQMNHVTEIRYMSHQNKEVHIRKIDADHYLNLDTGEICEFKHIENRAGSFNSLRQSFGKIRDLIDTNFTGAPNELFVTLTYAENMQDSKQLYADFKNFIKRFKYSSSRPFDYLAVAEPQARGAWHMHVLFRFRGREKAFVKNAQMASLWGHGFVRVKSMQHVTDIGLYLTAYLGDVELSEDTLELATSGRFKVEEKLVEGKSKAFIKGGRLPFYPVGMNLFRKSRGIVYPEAKVMTYSDAQKKTGSSQPVFSKSYSIDIAPDKASVIAYERYNTRS